MKRRGGHEVGDSVVNVERVAYSYHSKIYDHILCIQLGNYSPTLLLGVCVTREPAPMPECLGVPGTMIFEALPLDVLMTSASSAACFAVLRNMISVLVVGIGLTRLTLLAAWLSLSRAQRVWKIRGRLGVDFPVHQSSSPSPNRTQNQAQLKII